MRKRFCTISAAPLAVLLALAACGGDDPAAGAADPAAPTAVVVADSSLAGLRFSAETLPDGVTPGEIRQGAQLYGTACIVCHGPAGAGTQLAPPLADDEWIGIDGDLPSIIATIHSGVAAPESYPIPMPPLGGGAFTDPEVRALAAYVYVLSHPS